MEEQRLEIRRLGKEELDLIYAIQEEYTDFLAFYPGHSDWLPTAIKEIDSGKRIAFGAFLEFGRDTFFPEEARLAGSCIVQKGQKVRSIEIKNFIVSTKVCVSREVQELVREGLLEYVEASAIERGFNIVEIEIPVAEILLDFVNFYLQSNFLVVRTQQSRYEHQDIHYYLEKKLISKYVGDPFDCLNIAKWFVQESLGFIIEGDEHSVSSFYKNDEGRKVKIPNSFQFLLNGRNQSVRSSIKIIGSCFYSLPYYCKEDILSDLEKIDCCESEFRIYVDLYSISSSKYPAEDLRQEFALRNIKYVNCFDLIDGFGDLSRYTFEKLERSKLGGVLVVVDSNLASSIRSQMKEIFYVLPSGFGNQLANKSDYSGITQVCVFCAFRQSQSGVNDLMAWGYSEIIDAIQLPANDLNDFISRRPHVKKIWGEKDLDYYFKDSFQYNYNENKKVTLLELSAPHFFEEEKNVFTISEFGFVSDLNEINLSSEFSVSYIDEAFSGRISILPTRETDSVVLLKKLGEQGMISEFVAAIELMLRAGEVGEKVYEKAQDLIAALKKSDVNPEVNKQLNNVLVQGALRELDAQTTRWNHCLDGDYTDLDKERIKGELAFKTLKTLESISSIKDAIPEYDTLVQFFTDQKKIFYRG